MGENLVTPDEILKYCLESLNGTVLINSWGERGIFYDPDRKLKRGVYILPVKEKDGNHDRSSKLNRDGVYRVNLGIRKRTFSKMFGPLPACPDKDALLI